MRAGETPTHYQQVWHSHDAETRETHENKVCRQGPGTTLRVCTEEFLLGHSWDPPTPLPRITRCPDFGERPSDGVPGSASRRAPYKRGASGVMLDVSLRRASSSCQPCRFIGEQPQICCEQWGLGAGRPARPPGCPLSAPLLPSPAGAPEQHLKL